MRSAIRSLLGCVAMCVLAACGGSSERVAVPVDVEIEDVSLPAWGVDAPLPGEDRSATGAVMGAVRLSQIGQDLLYSDSADIDGLVSKVSTTSGRSDLIADVNEVVAPFRRSLALADAAPTWMREMPVTAELVEFDGEVGGAVVDVWVWQFFSRSGYADASLSCSIATYELVWSAEEDMWLFDSHSEDAAACPGLNAERHPVRAGAGELDELLDGHRLVDGTAGAVDGVWS